MWSWLSKLLQDPRQCSKLSVQVSIYPEPCCGGFMVTEWRNWVDHHEEIRVRIRKAEMNQNSNTKFYSSAILLEPVLLTACQVNHWVWNRVLSASAGLHINTRNPRPPAFLSLSWWTLQDENLGSGHPVHFGTEAGHHVLEFQTQDLLLEDI